jgi:hypothetical protein
VYVEGVAVIDALKAAAQQQANNTEGQAHG